jgi:hypothetical protein
VILITRGAKIAPAVVTNRSHFPLKRAALRGRFCPRDRDTSLGGLRKIRNVLKSDLFQPKPLK